MGRGRRHVSSMSARLWEPAPTHGREPSKTLMLEIIDLAKRYGSVVALDGAGFAAAPGRLVGFLGPNGAGKTTAMRCVFGLVRPDRGRVAVDVHPAAPADEVVDLRRLQAMLERGSVRQELRVRETVPDGRRIAGRVEQLAEDRLISGQDLPTG